jgi:hypothetical protein
MYTNAFGEKNKFRMVFYRLLFDELYLKRSRWARGDRVLQKGKQGNRESKD